MNLKYIALCGVAFIVACANIAQPTDLRAPVTDAEWRDYNAFLPSTKRVGDVLYSANRDICPKIAASCALEVHINVSSGIGAFSDQASIYLTTPLLKFLQNDDERSMTIGHEWAHVLLGHRKLAGTMARRTMEIQADCVGSLLAKRSGYNIEIGVQALRRMGRNVDEFFNVVLSPMSDYPAWDDRYGAIMQASRSVGSGKPTPEAIETVCGVSLK